jgi:dienelactone hydrolase
VADDLRDFTRTTFEHNGTTRTVFRLGEGPAVIVMAEMPGITPRVADFARRVADLGCSVWLPDLFGIAGEDPGATIMARAIVPACVSKEFAAFATGRTAPVVDWLRALAARAHAVSGGPGIGAVGMCFTGGFALGMMADERMLAPVLSQPSLPIALPGRSAAKADLHLGPADLDAVRARAAAGVDVLGLRFSCDRLAPGERFETLRRELGDRFIGVEIDSSKGNPHAIRNMAHSVLTEDLVDEPGHPTHDALEQVLAFFRDRLLPPT